LPPSQHITQADVAKAAGVNRATVSLAIRNHPSISAATRERIQRLAEELGYRPDPMLSALSTYRNSRRPPEFRGTLAWLARSKDAFDWRRNEHFAAYFEGAQRRAAELGYNLDVVDLGEQGLTWKRAAAVIRARGIAGVILCPQPEPDTNLADFPWHEFVGVTFGYSIAQPALHSVAAAQFRAAYTAYREASLRGYRRIGFALNRNHDRRIDHNYLGGYLTARELDDGAARIPPLLFERFSKKDLKAWLDEHRPDAVMGGEYLATQLRGLGRALPDDLGFVSPFLASHGGPVSGVVESSRHLAEAAVDSLVGMLHAGKRGIPERPQRILIEGIWNEGSTLRPAHA
jgi:DNA-binding LacI/PurR family transcriptional regulator